MATVLPGGFGFPLPGIFCLSLPVYFLRESRLFSLRHGVD